MRRKIAASADFLAPAFQISGLVRDNGADSVRIGPFPHQFHAEPVVLFSRIVAKQYRRPVVNRDQHVNRTVVIEITERPDRKSTRLNSSHITISYAVFCLK